MNSTVASLNLVNANFEITGSLQAGNPNVPRPSVFELPAGSVLRGPGSFAIKGIANMAGGTMQGPGVTTIEAAATLELKGGADNTIDNREMIVKANSTVKWTAADIELRNGGKITVEKDGTFLVQTDNFMSMVNIGTFTNHGTFRKDMGNGTAVINVGFNNLKPEGGGTPLVEVTVGKLQFEQPGTHDAEFRATVTGAEIIFEESAHTLKTGTQLTGAGKIMVEASTFHIPVNNSVNNGAEMVFSGTISGGGGDLNDLDHSVFNNNGKFRWNNGDMLGIVFNNHGELLLETNSGKGLAHSALVNWELVKWMDGNLTMTSSDDDRANITNYKTFEVHGANTMSVGGDSLLKPQFVNTSLPNDEGVFVKVDGMATDIDVDFINLSTVNLNGRTVNFNGLYEGEAQNP